MIHKVGFGFDVHRFITGNSVILGGVRIPSEFAIEAHSDGDVLLHAICDAILGALGEGDIGDLFPDTDSTNKNRDSVEFLNEVLTIMKTKQYSLCNIDCTIVAEKPKLMAYKQQIKQFLAQACSLPNDCVNIKATTNEKLGFVGRMEGIQAYSVCLLKKD